MKSKDGRVGAAKRTEVLTCLAIVALALVVRLCYLAESSANPTFDNPILDSWSYHDIATAIARTDRINEGLFWQPVFYPLFLSMMYSLSDFSIVFVKVVQVFLGAITCLLTYRLGQRIFGRRIGIAAGVITALCGPLIFFESELLATGWAAFWSVALVLLFLATREKQTRWHYLALGVCGALSVITRPTFLPFFVAGFVWLGVVIYRADPNVRELARGLGIVLAGFLLIAIPLAVKNHRLTGHFGFLPASGGMNVYIGNNPNPEETRTARIGEQWDLLRTMPAREGGAIGMWEGQKFFYQKVTDYAADQPLHMARGMAVKAAQFVNSREIPRNVDVYMFGKWSRLLRLLTWRIGGWGFPFGIILPLALAGLVYYWRQVPLVLKLLLILYSLSIIMVFVSARYRVPIVPLLAILAAAGGAAVYRTVRTERWLAKALLAAGAVPIILLTTLPGPFPEEKINYEAEMYYAIGTGQYYNRQPEQAIASLLKAVEVRPDYASAHNNISTFLISLKRYDEATVHARRALAISPDFARPFHNLGTILFNQGDPRGAIPEFRKALSLQPDLLDSLNALALILAYSEDAEIRDTAEAVRLAERACRITQNRAPQFLDTLALTLAADGRLGEAIATAERALGRANAARNYALARTITGHLRAFHSQRRRP